MDKRDLQQLLGKEYSRELWINSIYPETFSGVKFFESPQKITDNNQEVEHFVQLGYIKLDDEKQVALFELKANVNVKLKRNRVKLNTIISNKIGDGNYTAAIALIYQENSENYRLTFCGKNTIFDQEIWDFKENQTDTKRFTYYGGKGETNRTLAERFIILKSESKITIKDIIDIFNVEKLSKEFFDKYKKEFEKFWTYIAKNPSYNKLFLEKDRDKQIRDFSKKLLGRIVFLHFLQKKGWMGCDSSKEGWKEGNKQFMQDLFLNFEDKDHFHSKCLSQLFFDTLNNGKRENSIFTCDGLNGELNGSKIPYLNGGLFDTDAEISKLIDFPSKYFENLFDFFSQYNFTIDENDSNDHEVGIDPEMLGHIFENLLEDNKDKGAFYTPKVIVQFMCQESLIEYLATKLRASPESKKYIAIEELIRKQLAQGVNDLDILEDIAQALYEVKICDPAIGSGAFPMGILNEIYQIIFQLWDFERDSVSEIWKISNSNWQPHIVKKNIIQHSIYGVDIENGAVDIARLRFWLALVVDEEEPMPLPNLDYKIMQGNSLLESFEGIDLSNVSQASNTQKIDFSSPFFSGNFNRKSDVNIQNILNDYFTASSPESKNKLNSDIDQFVIDYIHEAIEAEKMDMEDSLKNLNSNLSKKRKHLKTPEEIIKLEQSKEFKNSKQLEKQLNEIINREIKINQLINSNQKPFFLWHLFFKDVFDDGGFDIVIANPPYVEFKNLKKEIKNLIEPKYQSLKGKYDLYIAFIELYNQLLKTDGVAVSIHPTRFMQRDYGTAVRKLLNDQVSIKSIVDFVDKKVFENALAYTGVFIIKKTVTPKQKFLYARALSDKIIRNIEELRYDLNSKIFEFTNVETEKLGTDLWIFQNDEIDIIFNIVREGSSSLESLLDGIYQGIATGKDLVFVLSDKDIIQFDIERDLLKPFLKGKDIAPFKISYKNKYLIYPYDNSGKVIPEDNLKQNFPNLYNYLENKRKELSGRGYFDKSNKLWFELWNQRNPDRFEQMKIVTLDNAKRNSFAFDDKNYFGSTTVYNLIKVGGDDIFYSELLLILNSELLTYYHSKNTIPQAGGYLRYQAIFIKDLPIKLGLPKEIVREFIDSNYSIPSEEFSFKYNQAVYQLYGINDEQIKFIRTQLKS